jgi:hypothetical protein
MALPGMPRYGNPGDLTKSEFLPHLFHQIVAGYVEDPLGTLEELRERVLPLPHVVDVCAAEFLIVPELRILSYPHTAL